MAPNDRRYPGLAPATQADPARPGLTTAGPSRARPSVPPAYRPKPAAAVAPPKAVVPHQAMQAKAAPALNGIGRSRPHVPPVYRPQSAAGVAQRSAKPVARGIAVTRSAVRLPSPGAFPSRVPPARAVVQRLKMEQAMAGLS